MLKVRVIPTLLWKDYGLVKGVAFDSWRRIGPVLPAVKVYNARDVDELMLLDITATLQHQSPDTDSVRAFAVECSVPFAVGGGITTNEQILGLLHAGADKVTINSAAYAEPGLIERASARFGAQCVVVSIDVRTIDGRHRCVSRCGSRDEGRNPHEWAREVAERGAGEILLTSVERDGTMRGYDLQLVEKVAHVVDIPVIASGGAGSYEHMVSAVRDAGASAVAAASMFHFTEQTPAGAKQALSAAGIPVRRNFIAI